MVKDFEKGRMDKNVEVLDIKVSVKKMLSRFFVFSTERDCLILSFIDSQESFDQGPRYDNMYPDIWGEESDLPGFREVCPIDNFHTYTNSHKLQFMELLCQQRPGKSYLVRRV